VALHKPATQSHLSNWSTLAGASGGVDGVKNGKYGFCTRYEEDPWWQVDLLGRHEIEEIVIYNRLDSDSDRADSLRILVSFNGVHWRELPEWTGGRFGGIDGNPARVRPANTEAEFIRLQLKGWTILHLDEVEVYGVLRGEEFPMGESFSF
jgi:hypothetical protein